MINYKRIFPISNPRAFLKVLGSTSLLKDNRSSRNARPNTFLVEKLSYSKS